MRVNQYKESPSEMNLLAVWGSISNRVWQKATKYCKDSCFSGYEQDIMQESFLLLSEALQSYEKGNKTFTRYFLDWFVPRARKIALFGKSSGKADLSVDAISLDAPLLSEDDSLTLYEAIRDPRDPYKQINEADYWAQVMDLIMIELGKLPIRQKIILWERLINGKSLRQIHKDYLPDMSYDRVATAWHKGLRHLQKRLTTTTKARELRIRSLIWRNRATQRYYSGGVHRYETRGFTSCVEDIALYNVERTYKYD